MADKVNKRMLALIATMMVLAITFVLLAKPMTDMGPDDTVEETDTPADGSNKHWWVDSGAYFYIQDGIGSTVRGDLPDNNKWRIEYAAINPKDTDDGYHPQNIFRLLTKSKWNNSVQNAYFRINEYWLSESPNRAEHNGIFFFSRYVDENNLYYAGIRVDGNATIKKKIGGQYYIMQMNKVFPGTYDPDSNPELIPQNTWIGLKSAVTDNPDGTVSIRLYVDRDETEDWALVAEATDDGSRFGGPALTEGSGGVRTDFMDMSVKKYRIENINKRND